MFCPNCGAQNDDNSYKCVQCGKELRSGGGAPASPVPPGTQVPNYLVPAILTLCCCWPVAIVAIVFAAQVNGKLAAGDLQGAIRSSEAAKKWAWISFGLGVTVQVISLGIQVAIYLSNPH